MRKEFWDRQSTAEMEKKESHKPPPLPSSSNPISNESDDKKNGKKKRKVVWSKETSEKFFERIDNFEQEKETKLEDLKQEHHLDYSFNPTITPSFLSQFANIDIDGSFLDRMEDDLDRRREREEKWKNLDPNSTNQTNQESEISDNDEEEEYED